MSTLASVIGRDIAANRPAAGIAGRLFFDTTNTKLQRDNGSSWDDCAETAGLGSWTDYTPTWTAVTTNPTLGSTTILGRYKALDSKTLIVIINISITTGGSWNAGSGSYLFTLPGGYTAGGKIQVVSAHVLDQGTTHFAGVGKVLAGSTQISETVIADASNPKLLGHNVPITWATGDQVNISGIIEVA